MPFYSDTLCSQKFYWRKNRTKHPLKQVKGSLSIKGKKLLQSILGSNVKSLQCQIFKEIQGLSFFLYLKAYVNPVTKASNLLSTQGWQSFGSSVFTLLL